MKIQVFGIILLLNWSKMSFEHLFNDFMQIIGPFMIILIIFQILNHHLGPHEVYFLVNLTKNPLFVAILKPIEPKIDFFLNNHSP